MGQLAYVRLTEGYWQVWVRDLETGRDEQVTHTHADKRLPAWGSDGTLYFRTNNAELFRWKGPGHVPEPYRPESWPAIDPVPAPSERGDVAFARIHPQVRDSSAILIAQRGGDLRLLTPGPGFRMQLAWSPDGERLAYVRTFEEGRSEIREVVLPGGHPGRLTPGARRALHPAYAPDGRTIAYEADTSGDFEIWVQRPGDERERLTSSPGLDAHPAWSPDGAQLAFTTQRRGALEIWVMRTDGSNPYPLVEDAPSMDPARR